jgi:hypothetical protein
MCPSLSLVSRRLVLAGGVLPLLLVLGCGSGRGTVYGKVTNVGTPITAGTVSFFPESGQPVAATIGSDGSYSAADVPLGKVRVAVLPPKKKNPAEEMGFPPDLSKRPNRETSKPEYAGIPEVYRDPAKSGLVLEVTGGKQEFPIDMR